jgi:hypothetical protein
MNEIKWAWQRVVRGYDDRVYWGFDGYFIQVLPALREFCHRKIRDENFCKYNPEKAEVFSSTLSKILSYDLIDEYTIDMMEHEGIKADLFGYIGKHISYYWD